MSQSSFRKQILFIVQKDETKFVYISRISFYVKFLFTFRIIFSFLVIFYFEISDRLWQLVIILFEWLVISNRLILRFETFDDSIQNIFFFFNCFNISQCGLLESACNPLLPCLIDEHQSNVTKLCLFIRYFKNMYAFFPYIDHGFLISTQQYKRYSVTNKKTHLAVFEIHAFRV